MLPRTRGLTVTNWDRFTAAKKADAIRNDAIGRPAATADYVPRAGGGDTHWRLRKERAPIRGDNQLSSGLARAVRIVAAERIFFTITVKPLPVLVALIGRDHDGRALVLH